MSTKIRLEARFSRLQPVLVDDADFGDVPPSC